MLILMLWLLGGSPMQPAITRCAACHLANMAIVPGAEHLGEWQRSAHAKHGVGCDKCHGGDPWTYEPREAHRGVLSPVHPSSMVNPRNLVRTCAPCHERNALAFATTLHATLVEAGDRRAPTCLTCHGVMSARVPSPSVLEARCASCHPPGSARGDYATAMRAAIESLNAEEARADALQDQIERMSDGSARVALLVALFDTRTMLKNAVAAVHRVDPRTVTEQSVEARRRLDILDERMTDADRQR
jgi:cytochrome c554/c'-like protein